MILWPLTGINPSDPTQGGFGFLDATPEGVAHPGIDLNSGSGANADCGVAILAADEGQIVFRGYHVTASGRGFGNHYWQRSRRTGDYLHYCHLHTAAAGETVVQRGHVLGTCGSTAGWSACHLHWEVWNGAYGPPPAWDYWPVGQSRAWVAAHYRDPIAWLAHLAALIALEGETVTPEQQTILDAAARQTAAGNTIASGGDLDWWIGTWKQLASDKESLAQLLTKAQQERDAAALEVAQLKAQGSGAAVDLASVAVTLTDGRTLTR